MNATCFPEIETGVHVEPLDHADEAVEPLDHADEAVEPLDHADEAVESVQLPFAEEDESFHHPDLLGGAPLSDEAMSAFAEECAAETLQQLLDAGHIPGDSLGEIRSRYSNYIRARREEDPISDVLVFLVNPANAGEFDADELKRLDQWSDAVLKAIGNRAIGMYPFLHKSRVPAIYRELPPIYQFCQSMMTPIVQAQERELITVASINPVTARKVAETLTDLIEEESGRPPISFVTVAPGEHWRHLVRKHFGI